MSDEEEISLEDLEKSGAEQVKQFFAGEAEEDFVEKQDLETLVQFYASIKATKDQAEKHLKEAGDKIKRLLNADRMEEKKVSKQIGGHTVLLTRRAGSVKIDYERYIVDVVGEKELQQLQAEKEAVKRGELESKYIEVGKDSVSLEVI